MIYSLWILLSAWLVCTGWVLSLLNLLNVGGYALSLLLLGLLILWLFRQRGATGFLKPFHPWSKLARRFRRPLPLVYLFYLIAALVGGALYPPTNYDALCYRLPRILHWWSEGKWHWIGGWNGRMDISGTGMEWLMAPLMMLLKTDRLLFLINVISYALLPGLIYSTFTGLGISRRVAWCWMWILSAAYCFVLQAGSVGNDCLAAVYLLAAVVFALRAVRTSSWSDAALSLLAAALLTGTKACNLPLLLPLAFVMIPLWRILFLKPYSTLMLCVVAVAISFLPIAASNSIHTGDWSGDPFNKEKMKLSSPIAGIAGNSLQALFGAVATPMLPNAKSFSDKTEQLITATPLRKLREHFPRLGLWLGEMPTEEGAGVGVGITLLVIVSILGGVFLGFGGIVSQKAMIFGTLAWVALTVFMAKMGSESTARLIAPYYIVIMIPLLVLRCQERVIRSRFWKSIAVVCMLMAMAPLVLSPGRPLLPVKFLITCAGSLHSLEGLSERINRVYSVYENRSDCLALVRDQLPTEATVIGFAGTGNDSEYSFWKPLGVRKVRDLNPDAGKMPDLVDVDVIVGSEWGINDRYHMKADELAARVYGNIIWQGKIAIMAGREPQEWNVITPIDGQAFRVTK